MFYYIYIYILIRTDVLHLIANILGDQQQQGRYFCSLSRPITVKSRIYNQVAFGMSWTTNIAILIIHTFGQPFMYYLVSRSNKVKSTETSINKVADFLLNKAGVGSIL